MEDSAIIQLYWDRDEAAIRETDAVYGQRLQGLSQHILDSREDARECVNDACQGAWDSIPPNRPENLKTYLGKLTRRICMKRWRSLDTRKRGGGEIPLSLEELGECVPDGKRIDEALAAKELADVIDRFLRTLPRQERQVFVLRYWYGFPVKEICKRSGFGKSKLESMLHRTRRKLRETLGEEGYLG